MEIKQKMYRSRLRCTVSCSRKCNIALCCRSLCKISSVGYSYFALSPVLADSGSQSFSSQALSLAVGFAVGYCLGYLVTGYKFAFFTTKTIFPRWVSTFGLLLAAVVMVLTLLGSGLVGVELPFGWAGRSQSVHDVVNSFGLGFMGCFCSIVLRKVAFPSFFPATEEEAHGRRENFRRGILIVVGILVAFVILATIVFSLLALVVYAVGTFAR